MTFLKTLLLFTRLVVPNPELDKDIEEVATISGGNPVIMAEKGQAIFETGRLEGDCQKILVGYGILLEAYNKSYGQGMDTLPRIDTSQCPIHSVRIHRAEAVRRFDLRQYEEARQWFLRALQASSEPKDLASLKQSIGMTYYMAYELDSAMHWLLESTQYGLDLLTSISLSNLSNVSYIQGEFEESLKWSTLAEDRLIEEFQDGIDAKEFQKRMDLVLINQVLAALELGNILEAQRTYGRMSLDDAFPGLAQEYFHTALKLSWALNDPYPIEIHGEMYGEHLMMDSAAAVERFGPTLCLIEPWRSRWAQGQPDDTNAWSTLRTLPTEQLPDLIWTHGSASDSEQEADSTWILVLLNLAAVGGLGIWWRQKRRKKSLQMSADPNKLLQLAREAIYQPNEKNRELGKQAVLALCQTIPAKRKKAFPSNLTAREVEILYAAAIQERPKSTANRLGLSSKSVYMLRTDVRRKLNLPDGEKIEDWLTKMQELNHE